MTRLLLLLLLAPLPLLAGVNLCSVKLDESASTLSISSPFSVVPPSGFAPASVQLSNRTNSTLELTLSFSTQPSYSYGSGKSRQHQLSISAAPGQSTRQNILIPIEVLEAPFSGSSDGELKINFSGRGLKGERRVDIPLDSSLHSDQRHFVAMSESLHLSNGSRLASLSHPALSSASDAERVALFIPSELPSQATAYRGVDMLLLSRSEWLSLKPEVQSALKSWVFSGGSLSIAAQPRPTSQELGLDVDEAIAKGDDPHIHPVGFGSINLISARAEDLLLNEVATSRLPFKSQGRALFNQRPANALTQFLNQGSSNRLLLVLLLAGFAIAVGPVNLFVLAPANKRHRLLFTTPLIALITSLLLALGFVFSDGFGGQGERIALVSIEKRGDAQISHITQEQASHAGIIFNTDFELEPGSSIRPFRQLTSQYSQFLSGAQEMSAFSYNTRDSGDKVVAHGDWFASRTDSAQQIETSRPGRGGLRIEMQDGRPVATSSLDFPLTPFSYLDGQGRRWYADSLPSGTPVTLDQAAAAPFDLAYRKHELRLSSELQTKLNSAFKTRHSFLGFSKDFPMVETLDSIDWTESSAIITGQVAP